LLPHEQTSGGAPMFGHRPQPENPYVRVNSPENRIFFIIQQVSEQHHSISPVSCRYECYGRDAEGYSSNEAEQLNSREGERKFI
jgi:hypothetical protein